MIPITKQIDIDIRSTVVDGGFNGGTNINSIGSHVFTYTGTLKTVTQYERIVSFTIRATTSSGTSDLIDLNYPVGNEALLDTGKLEFFHDASTTFIQTSHSLTVYGLITSSGVGGDSFDIKVTSTATTSLDVSSMSAFYKEVHFT